VVRRPDETTSNPEALTENNADTIGDVSHVPEAKRLIDDAIAAPARSTSRLTTRMPSGSAWRKRRLPAIPIGRLPWDGPRRQRCRPSPAGWRKSGPTFAGASMPRLMPASRRGRMSAGTVGILKRRGRGYQDQL